MQISTSNSSIPTHDPFIDIKQHILTILDDYANCYKMNTTIKVLYKIDKISIMVLYHILCNDNYYCYFMSL